jgi:hypothetical protein
MLIFRNPSMFGLTSYKCSTYRVVITSHQLVLSCVFYRINLAKINTSKLLKGHSHEMVEAFRHTMTKFKPVEESQLVLRYSDNPTH